MFLGEIFTIFLQPFILHFPSISMCHFVSKKNWLLRKGSSWRSSSSSEGSGMSSAVGGCGRVCCCLCWQATDHWEWPIRKWPPPPNNQRRHKHMAKIVGKMRDGWQRENWWKQRRLLQFASSKNLEIIFTNDLCVQ